MDDTHLPYDDEDEESSPEEMEGLSSIGISAIVVGVIACALIAYFLLF
jgi:hypothetical protein